MDQKKLCLGCMEEKGQEQTCPHCGFKEGFAPESLLHLPPGTELQGKYIIGRALGQGGFGITYLAWDKNLKIKLAIKEYLPQQLATRRAGQNEVSVVKSSLSGEFNYGLQKFLEEARTLARFIEHPNVVSVRDYFEANNTAYLVMNYHEGVTLQQYLQARGGKIAFEQALDIFMPVLDALKEVHAAGILHRDISPDNLLINTRGQVVLIDFGAARQAVGEKSGSLSVIMKAGYSPLEQYQSKGRQGPWTDIYAVAATIYRSLTGITPPEAFDRVEEDPLKPLSKLNIEIGGSREQALLKALALRSKNRFTSVDEFRSALLSEETASAEEKFEVKKEPAVAGVKDVPAVISAKTIKDKWPGPRGSLIVEILAAVIFAGLLFYGAVFYFSSVLNRSDPGEVVTENHIEDDGSDVDETPIPLTERFDSETFKKIEEADYIIDYSTGTIPLSDLETGSRVVDPSWEWVYQTGPNYSGEGEKKPVIWIVVAKDHYEGLDVHVTLLSEELIGKYLYDNSTNRGSPQGANHWGESGTPNAELGLRPWLNSTGNYGSSGFYDAFSELFKEAVLITAVTNRDWENGTEYRTEDKVFIPSTTELGDMSHIDTYEIGTAFPYFEEMEARMLTANIAGTDHYYWTRSPVTGHPGNVSIISSVGFFGHYMFSRSGNAGVRPVLNLESGTLVSNFPNKDEGE